MSKQADKAIAQLAALAESIRLYNVVKKSQRLNVSTTTAAAIQDPSKPWVLGACPWSSRALPKTLRRSMRRSIEGPRPRPAKSTERIFSEAPTPTPDWYFDSEIPLPLKLQELLGR